VSIVRRQGRAYTWAVIVLVLGVAASLASALAAAHLESRDAADGLERRTAMAQQAVTAEVRRYESTVAQLAAALGAQETLTADDFDMITAPLAGDGYAGASAVAFVVPVENGLVAETQARWRAAGARQLALRPTGDGQHYFIVFLTSLDGTDGGPGLDLAGAPEPTAAMVEARRSNRVAVSDAYVLLRDRVRNAGAHTLSFVMAAPVYSPGPPPTGRASGFRGWLIMALRGRGLAEGTLDDAAQGLVNVRLSAATNAGGETAAAVVESGPPSRHATTRTVEVPVAQQKWSLTVQRTARADRLESGFAHLGVIVGGAGTAVSVLLAALTWVLLSVRERARHQVRLATAELREQHDRHERLLETLSQMGEGVGVLEGERLVFVNDALAGMSGHPVADLLESASPATLLADDDALADVRRVRQALGDDPPPGPFVTRLRHRDGHVVPVEVTVARVVRAGHAQEVFVLRDLTERTRWQAELAERARDLERVNAELAQARDEAAAASRAKTDFLTTMSHEIRTPLNGVLGLTGMLLDTGLDDEQRDLAETASRAGESLLAIINDVLDLSKIEAGKLTVETRDDVELRPLLHDVADTFAAQAAAKHLDLVVEVAPECPRTLSTDPTRLRQILLNLAGNAVKFTAAGHVLIGAEVDGGELRLSVGDSGEGISETAQQRLFSPFEQADVSTTRRFGGTGLGLSISRHLAELLGGSVAVRSAPGKGSTFTVTLPLRVGPAGSPYVRPGVGLLAGRTVLLACAAPALRDHLARRLRSWGADVVAPVAPWPLPEPGQVDVAVVDARHGDSAPYAGRLVALAARAAVVLLTRPGQGVAAGAPGCVEVSVPVRPERLRGALGALLGDASPEAGGAGVVPAPAAPADDEPAAATPAAATPAVAGAQRRILVAEDNPVNQRIATAMLTKLGHLVDVVGTGREAVDAAQLVGYDAVLMDCQMPEMDGWEATATLRSIPATRLLPVIALTASATTEVREACLRAGMNGYLSKPVRLDELRDAIEAVLAPGQVTHTSQAGH
jgi:PAS domain S-box-containing protein